MRVRKGKSGGAGGGSEVNGGGARGGQVWNIFFIGGAFAPRAPPVVAMFSR